MGDSSAGLMQPFCYASGFSYEANKSNPIHDAFGQSVSFGRFMSESLAWEKWSTFSHNHNRYVEEAERFSRPGSVAQKKAFFEAHYKKLAAQKAAAAANSASSQTQQEHEEAEVDDIINTHNSQITSPKSELLFVSEENAAISSNVFKTTLPQSNKVEGAQAEKEHQAFVGKSMIVKVQNQLEGVDNNAHKEPSDKQGSNFDQEVLQSMGKKNAPVFSFKCLKGIGTSKSNRDNIVATPLNNKPSLSSAEKKRSNAKSVHMSLKFALTREINRLTASVMTKFETTRVGAGSIKASNLRTPTKASKNELQKYSSFGSLTEKKRNNITSPNISSPLSSRTEEKAANEKKKHGKNLNASEARKVQLHIKLKDNAKIKIRKLRQSFCFKARPLPDLNKEREDSKRGTKEVFVVQSKSSLSLKRLFHEKNGGSLALPLTPNSTMITTHENTSPNIQHLKPE